MSGSFEEVPLPKETMMSSANGTLSTSHALIAAAVILIFCACSALSIASSVPVESGFPVIITTFDEVVM